MFDQMNQYLVAVWGMMILLIVLDFIRWRRLNKQIDSLAESISRMESKKPTGCVICGKENFVRPEVEEDGVASILCQNCMHEYRIEGNQFEIRSKGVRGSWEGPRSQGIPSTGNASPAARS